MCYGMCKYEDNTGECALTTQDRTIYCNDLGYMYDDPDYVDDDVDYTYDDLDQ